MSSEKIWVSLDLGYASIGWTAAKRGDDPLAPEVLGAGSVFFEPDRCLASDRRTFRRQRRHIRATRTRIRRMKEFLLAQGVITPEIAKKKHLAPDPWRLASEALQGKKVLTPAELWAVLLWYAHNRGYDGNRLWSRHSRALATAPKRNEGDSDEGEETAKEKSKKKSNADEETEVTAEKAKEQEEKEQKAAAESAMAKYHTSTMAETVLAIEEDDRKSVKPLGYKARRMAFKREVVVDEVRKILKVQLEAKMPGLTEEVMRLILADPLDEGDALRGVEGIPKIYLGGYLFGQVRPRFDNRILTPCPFTGKNMPSKTSGAFLAFRWAHLLSTIRVGRRTLNDEGRRLTVAEMEDLNKHMEKYGRFTVGDFKDKVRELTESTEETDNLDPIFMMPKSGERLIRYPGRALLDLKFGMDAFKDDPETQKELKHITHMLALGKTVIEKEKRKEKEAGVATSLDKEKEDEIDKEKEKEKIKSLLKDPKIADEKSGVFPLRADLSGLSGRAPYATSVLKQATKEIFAGKDPWAKGGALDKDKEQPDPLTNGTFLKEDLEKDPEKDARQLLEEQIDRETNNHLARHRIKILTRLLQDIVKTYAENNPSRVENIVIEVSRDLRDFSGKTAVEIKKKIKSHLRPWEDAQKDLKDRLSISPENASASLIKKMRIARAMKYTCPYTGKDIDANAIKNGNVDVDHIIPHAQRQTDALDDLVLTFRQVNEMKGNRTARQFIREEGGNPVPGMENVFVMSEPKYLARLKVLKKNPAHEDKTINERRIRNLKTLSAQDAGMTPGMGTQTSVINKLAQRAIVGWFRSKKCAFKQTQIQTVPSAITAEVRSKFKLLGILAQFDDRLTETYQETRPHIETGDPIPVGKPKKRTIPKGKMRGLTHMHHAVDAIAILLTRMLLSTDDDKETQKLWKAMRRRRVFDEERTLLEATKLFNFTDDNKFKLRDDLPESTMKSIRKALGELRTVPYFSKRVGRLDIEQTQWRVVSVENGMVTLRQRDAEGKKKTPAPVPVDNVFGLNPDAKKGKLKDGKGNLEANKAVYQIASNYALAYYDDPDTGEPQIIRNCYVWQQIAKIAEAHGGKKPHLLRNGDLVKIKRNGEWYIWRVKSTKLNARTGILLDLTFPYNANTRFVAGKPYIWHEVNFENLLRNKAFRRLPHNLTGVPAMPIKPETQTKPPRGQKKAKGKECPITSSKSPDTTEQLSLL